MGHSVTIFDEHEHLGGMMRYGIPGFRTPREVLDAEIQRILDTGVETRLKCRIGTDVTLEALRKAFDAVFLGMGAQSGRPLPAPGGDAPNVVTATAFLKAFNDGRLRHVGKRVVVIGGGDTSIDVATVARRLGHIGQPKPTDFPEDQIAGHIAHDVAEVSVKQGAEVVLTSVFGVDKMQANKHEIEQALAEGIAIRGGLAPVSVVKDASGRAIALKVARCEAKFVGGKLEIKNVEGSEEDIPADLIVSAIGQAVDFTGLEEFDSGKGNVAADRNYQIPGKPGTFAGGDVLRPHLLTTAIGHGAIAADGIDRFLRGEDQEKRPKVDVHAFDLKRKMVERGLAFSEATEPMHGTDQSTVGIHNFDNRSDRYVIPHEELFLGHFTFTPRNKREITTLTKESALGNFEERWARSPGRGRRRGQALHKHDQCFECDNCVVYCPRPPWHACRRRRRRRAATSTPTTTSASAATSARTCARPATSRWGWASSDMSGAGTFTGRVWRGAAKAALVVAFAGSALAADAPSTRVPMPGVTAPAEGKCVEDTEFMRRNHAAPRSPARPHGARGIGPKHSLANCVSCHAAADRASHRQQRRVLRRLPPLRRGQARLLRVPRRPPLGDVERRDADQRSAEVSDVDRGRRQILAWGAAMAGVTLAPGVTLFDLAHGRAPTEPASSKVRWGMLVDLLCDACACVGDGTTSAQWIQILRRAARRRLPRRRSGAPTRHRARRPAHLHRLPLRIDGVPAGRSFVHGGPRPGSVRLSCVESCTLCVHHIDRGGIQRASTCATTGHRAMKRVASSPLHGGAATELDPASATSGCEGRHPRAGKPPVSRPAFWALASRAPPSRFHNLARLNGSARWCGATVFAIAP
jgi:thioredoxin reductase